MRLEDTKIQLKVLELAKSKNLDVSKISRAQYRALAVEAQGLLLPARAARAIVSRVKTAIITVTDEVIRENEEICHNCPHDANATLKDGTETCLECGCSGKFLTSKRKDPAEHCPLTASGKRVDRVGVLDDDPPLWNNVGKPLKD